MKHMCNIFGGMILFVIVPLSHFHPLSNLCSRQPPRLLPPQDPRSFEGGRTVTVRAAARPPLPVCVRPLHPKRSPKPRPFCWRPGPHSPGGSSPHGVGHIACRHKGDRQVTSVSMFATLLMSYFGFYALWYGTPDSHYTFTQVLMQ